MFFEIWYTISKIHTQKPLLVATVVVSVGAVVEKNQRRTLKMSVITIKQLLEAGVHFGHHTRRWNPKMKEYIFTERNGIYIIDLQKTVKKFEEAYMYVRDLSVEKGTMLFVGTKKQAADAVKEEATRCGMYYVNSRWPGGMLTNFKTIRKSIARLRQIEKMEAEGIFDSLTKKEVAKLLKDHILTGGHNRLLPVSARPLSRGAETFDLLKINGAGLYPLG